MPPLNFRLDEKTLKEFMLGIRDEALKKLLGTIFDSTLKAETAEQQLGAKPYERREGRQAYQNGYRERSLTTRVGTLNGTSFSKSTVSALCQQLDLAIEAFQECPLRGAYPYIIVDDLYMKARKEGDVRSKGRLIALGIQENGR